MFTLIVDLAEVVVDYISLVLLQLQKRVVFLYDAVLLGRKLSYLG
jgi:hypothetical protein